MRYQYLIVACAAWVSTIPFAAATTIQEAMNVAIQSHPESRMAQLQFEAAIGSATEQKAYAYNPELTVEPQRRTLAGGGKTNDYYITLSQGIELGGKHGYKKAIAEAGIESANAAKRSTELQLQLGAATAFVDLYFAQKKDALKHQISALYKKIVEGMQRRQQAGEASKLDVNLLQSAYSTSINDSVASRQQMLQKRLDYFAATGQTQASELELLQLPTAWHTDTGIDDLVEYVWASRPDLQSLQHQADQFEALAKLASANLIPDIAISASVGREAGDHLAKLGITVPFPILNSHSGAYRAALANEERVRTNVAWARQRLHYEIESALRNHLSTSEAALSLMDSSILDSSTEAIRLARKAYEAGELEPEEMVFRIKQAVDAQIAAFEAFRQAWLSRIKLAEVLGNPALVVNNITVKGTNHE